MAPKTAQAGNFSVRESLCRMVDSKELRPILDRFHERLAGMGAGVSIEGSRVKLDPGAHTCRATSLELITGHMFGALRFEGVFDSDCMQMAADLGCELNARRAEIMSNACFLAQLNEMLMAWEKADDPAGIAKLCLGIYSSTGANPRMVSMAEIDNPMLVIEMTKSYVGLLLLPRAPIRAPDNDNAPGKAQAASDGEKRAESAEPIDAGKPACGMVSDAPSSLPVESKPPLIILEEKLRALGVGEDLAEELLSSKSCSKDPASCIRNLDAFIEKHGRGFTLVALHKSRQLLMGQDCRAVDNLLEEIRAIRDDKPLLAKYQLVVALLQKELDVPPESAYLMISSLKGTHLSEALAIENLKLLLSRVPRDKLKRTALSAPHRLAVARKVQALLDAHLLGGEVDRETLIRDIVEALGGIRPEAFVRAYVCRHLDSLSSRPLESAKRKADYAGRMLVKVAGMAGIPPDFVRVCMEKGIIDSKAIAKAYAAGKPVPAQRDAIVPPPPPTIPSACLGSGISGPEIETDTEPVLVAGAPRIEEAKEAIVPAAGQQGMAAYQEPEPVPINAGAAPSPPESVAIVTDTSEFEKKLEAALDARSVPYQISAQIMALAKGNGDAEEALYRFESAAALIAASIPPDENPGPRIRSFLSSPAHVEALCIPSRKAFFDRVISFNASIPARRISSIPPEGVSGNGIRHVSVAMGDERTLQKIRRYRVPMEMAAFFNQSNLDVHELIYVTLKIFRWLNGRQPQDVKKQDYQDNLRRFAGDAQRDVAAVHRRMICYPHNSRVGLMAESSMEPEYADFMRLLKKVNFYLLAG